MIKVHTGVPGTYKSCSMVHEIHFSGDYDERTVYAHAVDGWDRARTIQCGNPDCRRCRDFTDQERAAYPTIETWYEWALPGDLIVVDEAHYPFPSRREDKAPTYITRLTEHRHDGIDFWLLTPNMNFLDIAVRRLVELHVHFIKARTGRFTVTHIQAMQNDDQLKHGTRERFFASQYKKAYSLYKSADAHVKLKTKMPRKMILAFILPLLVIGIVWYGVVQSGNLRRATQSDQEIASDQPSLTSAFTGFASLGGSSSRGSSRDLGRSTFYEDPDNFDFTPRIENIPESAPAYDMAPTPSVQAPRLAACLKKVSTGGCSCFDQQGRSYRVTREFCSAWLSRPTFDRHLVTSSAGTGRSSSGRESEALPPTAASPP